MANFWEIEKIQLPDLDARIDDCLGWKIQLTSLNKNYQPFFVPMSGTIFEHFGRLQDFKRIYFCVASEEPR